MALLITRKSKFERFIWLTANRDTSAGDCKEFPLGGRIAAKLYEDENEENLALNVSREINIMTFGGLIKIGHTSLNELLKNNIFSFVANSEKENPEIQDRII